MSIICFLHVLWISTGNLLFMLQQNSLQHNNNYIISLGDKKLYDCSTFISKDNKSKFNE